jgi:alpha-acetolactate decarboxylase
MKSARKGGGVGVTLAHLFEGIVLRGNDYKIVKDARDKINGPFDFVKRKHIMQIKE